MTAKNLATLLLPAVVFVFVLAIAARSGQTGEANPPPVKLVGGIVVPGNPLRFDITGHQRPASADA